MLFPLDGRGILAMQVYRALRAAILDGSLRAGERLPATRTLAAELGVSRNTVLFAYDQLLGEGYASARQGSGTFVAAELPDPPAAAERRPAGTPAGGIRLSRYGKRVAALPRLGGGASPDLRWDFRYGRPPFDDFPLETWSRLVARRARAASALDLDYGSPKGERDLREAIAGHLARTRGVVARSAQILITAGSQQALDLVARVLLDPGDRVLIEEPHYPGAWRAFHAAGARLEAVPVDGEGLDLGRAGSAALGAKLAYVTPSHHFPTGAVLSLSRRLALLDWARRSRALIVEDDYDSEYRYAGRPIEALAGLDREGRVLYVGTFSKVVFPALRLGYLVLPPALVDAFTLAKAIGDSGSSRLGQLALADFLREGHFDRHVRRTKRRNAARRAALIEALEQGFGDRIEISGSDAGLHLVLWMRHSSAAEIPAIVERALAAGVGLLPVSTFYRRPPDRAGFLLGYAGLGEDEIREGIATLARALPAPAARTARRQAGGR